MTTYEWYQALIKPVWAPPSWVFGPVWKVLYLIIAITYLAVFYKAVTKKIPLMIALPFVLNLIFNFSFMPLQFGLQNNLLAAADILLIVGSLVWGMIIVYPYMKWVAYLNLPHLVWVSFATVLQLTITYLNW